MSTDAGRCTPLHLGPVSERVFGWYHRPEEHARRCGVVVCSPIGDEYTRAHRTLRHLAERLQRLGFPVLRFDFHGTGDSAGDERDPDPVHTWLEDIGRAIAALRARSGASEICLAGLRLGATLAMTAAAARGDIDSLVLWRPLLDGKSYVTETMRQHRAHRLLEPEGFAAEPAGWHPGGEQALGFLMTPPMIAALEQIDLRRVEKPARSALVAGEEPGRDRVLLDQLVRSGVDAEYRQLADQKFLWTSPHKLVLPEAALDELVGWLADRHPERLPSAPPALSVESPDGEERFLRFGPNGSLFGVLAHRRSSQPQPRAAILMLNAGTVHRVGPHRLYVKMARRWAGLGFPVLRMDLSGIGDSPAPADCQENLCYPRDGLSDVQAAMTTLETELGVDRFLVVGLCSGADLAFHVALREPRVTGAVMMNPLTFCVHDQTLVESYQPAAYYAGSLLDPRKLKRLLRGEVQLAGALGGLAKNLQGAARRLLTNRAIGDASNDVPALLRRMVARGVDTLLLAGPHDPGVAYVDHHFAAGMRALSTVRGFRRVDLRGTDHTFTSLFAQEVVVDTITEHLTERHLS